MARISAPQNDCRQPLRNDPCCPDCGALECLCRPRFFAGQLLSEQDLNRLDQYIRNKNRLHVRNLHGWGVVNGLLVLCDPCGDVRVTQGYAVDPCGNDIIVCEETRANLCELIRKCRQNDLRSECQPFRSPPNSNCADIEEEWVLAISYQEWQSRGVNPLRGTGAGASCGCGGGGSCSCGGGSGGCGCGGGSGTSSGGCGCGAGTKVSATARAVQAAQASTRRGVPVQCEPSVICEGYSFSVYRKAEDSKREDGAGLTGPFWDAFMCCARPLMDALPPMPTTTDAAGQMQPVAWSRWCCRFRDNLTKYFQQSRNASCEVLTRLQDVRCPNPQTDNFAQDAARALLELLAIWLEGLKNCLCLALLPPPPANTCDLRVPLATVRIRARDCRVLSVCNWTTERKLLLSWPTVAHWLSVVPIGALLRELLDKLCCTSLLDLFDRLFDDRDPQSTPVPGIAPNQPNNVVVAPQARMMSTEATPAAGAAAASPAAGTAAGKDDNDVNRNGDLASRLNLASGVFSTRFTADFSEPAANLQQLLRGMMDRERKGEALQLGALLNATSARFNLPENGQTLNTVERKNLPLVLLAETVVRPLMSSVLGDKRTKERMDELKSELSNERMAASAATAPAAPAADLELRQELDSLRREVQVQQAQIKQLMSKLG